MAFAGFYDLNCPTDDNIHGWYVDSEQSGIGYLLNYTMHIANVGQQYPLGAFYFALESSAHAHAAGYYIQYAKTYPWIVEWEASIEREGKLCSDDSQVMRFE